MFRLRAGGRLGAWCQIVVASIALSHFAAPIARACWCTDQDVGHGCLGRGALFFTGRVRAVVMRGHVMVVTIDVVRNVRGASGPNIELRLGQFGPEPMDCDSTIPTLAEGDYVRVVAEGRRLGACDHFEVLPNRSAALADPCGH